MKTLLMLLFVISLASLVLANGATGHCIWYGECSKNSIWQMKNCAYDGPAKPLLEEGRALLAKWCPHMLVAPNDKNIHTCCDTNQLRTLDRNLGLTANFLKHCPSCMTNFARHLCESTCAKDHSKFLEVLKKKTSGDGKEYIDEINFYISNNYLEGTFASCKQISLPNTKKLAMDFLCGQWGADDCTGTRWFYFMGDSDENPYVPFMIYYKNTSLPIGQYVPLNPPTLPCNK